MEERGKEQERRKSERLDVAFTLTYNTEKTPVFATIRGLINGVDSLMLDLSDLGMAITAEDDIPLGTQFYIEFNLINLHLIGDARWRHIKINGVATSDQALSNKSHRIGICFNKISEADKLAIRDYVKYNKYPPLT